MFILSLLFVLTAASFGAAQITSEVHTIVFDNRYAVLIGRISLIDFVFIDVDLELYESPTPDVSVCSLSYISQR